MATIILEYDARNIQAKKALDFILFLGLFEKREKNQVLNEQWKILKKVRFIV